MEEFGDLAGLFANEEGVAIMEVNVSCPNVKEGGSAFGQDPTLIRRVTETVRSRSGDKPVMVKLSPNVTDIALAARAAQDGGAHAISLINTLTGMAVDIRRRKPRLANGVGGLSGPAIKPVALRCVHQACRAVDIPAMGMGRHLQRPGRPGIHPGGARMPSRWARPTSSARTSPSGWWMKSKPWATAWGWRPGTSTRGTLQM